MGPAGRGGDAIKRFRNRSFCIPAEVEAVPRDHFKQLQNQRGVRRQGRRLANVDLLSKDGKIRVREA